MDCCALELKKNSLVSEYHKSWQVLPKNHVNPMDKRTERREERKKERERKKRYIYQTTSSFEKARKKSERENERERLEVQRESERHVLKTRNVCFLCYGSNNTTANGY